jgi:gamma-glutamylcyclotransferase (GGCT)/AIG2-like uncharacterized protein YtfP
MDIRYKSFVTAIGGEHDALLTPADADEYYLEYWLFIYGTLRKGQSNAWLLDGITEAGQAEFGGYARVTSAVIADLGGLPALYRVPRPGVMHRSFGEVWRVTESAMYVLDRFEGEGRHYFRDHCRADYIEDSVGGAMVEPYPNLELQAYLGPPLKGELKNISMYASEVRGTKVDYDFCKHPLRLMPEYRVGAGRRSHHVSMKLLKEQGND